MTHAKNGPLINYPCNRKAILYNMFTADGHASVDEDSQFDMQGQKTSCCFSDFTNRFTACLRRIFRGTSRMHSIYRTSLGVICVHKQLFQAAAQMQRWTVSHLVLAVTAWLRSCICNAGCQGGACEIRSCQDGACEGCDNQRECFANSVTLEMAPECLTAELRAFGKSVERWLGI